MLLGEGVLFEERGEDCGFDSNGEEVVPKVNDVSLVDEVFNRHLVEMEMRTFYERRCEVVSSSLVKSTKSFLGGMMRNYYEEGISSRWGFNGRGRGGINGKSFGDQRFTRNDNAHYVPSRRIGLLVLKGIYGKKCRSKDTNEGSRNNKGNAKENLKNRFSLSNKMIDKESKMKANAMVMSMMIEKGLAKNQAYKKVYDEVYRDEHNRIRI
nr:hypothetical protein [Tanacetum cinerariifolium]